MTEEGRQVVQCFRAVSAYGKEIEALCETLNARLTQEIDNLKDELPCKVAGQFMKSSREDEWDWIFTDVAYSLPLMDKAFRKKRAEMYLGYQISLTGDGMSFDGNEEPLLHVCFWDIEIGFGDEGVHMAYPVDQEHQPRLKDNRLILWEGSGADWKKYQWTFSLRLLELKTSQDLHDRVIKPAIALLSGVDVRTALPDDLAGLVIYPDESVLNPAVQESAAVE
ncbi:hypothetical protein Rfer_3051 [Rhodoferax ferrireducens T118]|uniref:Uncharacterized protein n=1 Tax=Albidiferax ferrireducens (strain ATCC BAA-621 / DSM 15236 / T118) TaxID=338969 RepID=Q21TZ2_ALBFT|nr:hypothetical protein [Rhodoferax ferrireducens]ABD70761.1 hypothetical protein Rfer_3051 [Rhodoferax ferrireducens T118]